MLKPLLLTAAVLLAAGCAATTSPPAALHNTIRWSTASEVENFGYDVYRARSQEGPFRRLTDQPLPGAGTTDEKQDYAFVDDTIEAGVVYYYYVESISLSGERERFTPVFASRPKYPDRR